jgi:hypothetical protein
MTMYTKTTDFKTFLSKRDVSTFMCTSQFRVRPFGLSVTGRSNLLSSVSSSTWRKENHVKRTNLAVVLNNRIKCAAKQIWNFTVVRPCLDFNCRLPYNFDRWFITTDRTRRCLLVEHNLRICTALQTGRKRFQFPMVSLEYLLTQSFRQHHSTGIKSASNRNE